jgi:hypothetical protein
MKRPDLIAVYTVMTFNYVKTRTYNVVQGTQDLLDKVNTVQIYITVVAPGYLTISQEADILMSLRDP